MKGLTMQSIKANPSLIPLFVCTGVGMIGAFGYLFRLATRNPDTSWNKKSNQLPYLKMKPTDQYKFYSPIRDYSKETFPKERPQLD
ncbi:cytochrome c oxidase subunit NDUFA4-like [Liolophura sinensis]|uniref:cytochrome c oxidase subunit NDUFA4-like n=1 Tax=Liolophura sinensis TaxID=3198878 RepID=UPI003158C7C7